MTYFLIFALVITFILCLITYILYPLAIWLVGKIIKLRFQRSGITPAVSIIISAYNEENDIENKINNTLELDYPYDKIESTYRVRRLH